MKVVEKYKNTPIWLGVFFQASNAPDLDDENFTENLTDKSMILAFFQDW